MEKIAQRSQNARTHDLRDTNPCSFFFNSFNKKLSINETIANAQAEFPQVLIDLMQDQKKESTAYDLAPNSEIEGAMLNMKELLTHFWSCFSDGRFKSDMEEKVNRMNQNLRNFEENTMRELRELEGISERSDFIQMCEMLEEANQKYMKLQEANAKRKRKI